MASTGSATYCTLFSAQLPVRHGSNAVRLMSDGGSSAGWEQRVQLLLCLLHRLRSSTIKCDYHVLSSSLCCFSSSSSLCSRVLERSLEMLRPVFAIVLSLSLSVARSLALAEAARSHSQAADDARHCGVTRHCSGGRSCTSLLPHIIGVRCWSCYVVLPASPPLQYSAHGGSCALSLRAARVAVAATAHMWTAAATHAHHVSSTLALLASSSSGARSCAAACSYGGGGAVCRCGIPTRRSVARRCTCAVTPA